GGEGRRREFVPRACGPREFDARAALDDGRGRERRRLEEEVGVRSRGRERRARRRRRGDSAVEPLVSGRGAAARDRRLAARRAAALGGRRPGPGRSPGRVTQASVAGATPGAEAYGSTAVRVARGKHFPAGKAGTTVVTIPVN